ncbi:MAG TPA: ATP-dependent DNA ligase, partial [archaeon]|nr:ATP-dependent DNA ligase [archaeon]
MRYSEIADIYERLEATTKKLEKRDILSDFYRSCSDSELPKSVLLSMGLVSTTEELGLAKELVKRIIAKSFGVEGKKIEEKFRELGDLGLIAEFFAKNKRQISLGKKELTISMVFENLNKLPGITGTGSQDKKILIVTELLAAATPKEAKYIVRAVLGDMRIGVAAGVVRNAIAKAFEKETKDIEKLYDVTGDFGIVAELAKKGKMKAVVMVNSPVRVMLADRAKDLKEAMDEFQEAAIEKKYDGLRLQIHKDGNSIKIFSRRLDEVTRQFPEIAEWSRDNLAAKQCIVEGEAIAIDKEGRPKPFQILSRRIQRKYDIEKTAKEIPVQVNLFDLIYFNGSFMDKPLKERWNKLKEILNETKRFRLADHIETKDIEKADRFYKESLSEGQEGVIVKNLSAPYQPGKRV